MRPRRSSHLAVWILLVALLAVQSPLYAAEVVHFSSAGLPPPSPLKLRQAKAQGKELIQEPGHPLWGHLSKPDKPAEEGPFPAVVLLHGCYGTTPWNERKASQLTELGYVTLVVDSLGPRSVGDVCREPLIFVTPDTRALDAHGALAYLQRLPFVDPARIAVVGWSHGGRGALAAVNEAGVAAHLAQRFAAAIAFYPYCPGGSDIEHPTLILLGEADPVAPVRPCKALRDRNREGGASVELVIYPGVFHLFDVPEFKEGLWLEWVDGTKYWNQYDEAAHADAAERVRAFLAKHLAQR